jgi:hypothetical protein
MKIQLTSKRLSRKKLSREGLKHGARKRLIKT